jgi:hypothetical protein
MATLNIYSPYRYSTEQADADGIHFTSEREPFTYEDLADNNPHRVVDGDTWHSLAYDYFHPITIPNEQGVEIDVSSQLGWIIRDFQPVPVLDPYIKLVAGELIIIPSRRTVLNKVFDSDRRRYS